MNDFKKYFFGEPFRRDSGSESIKDQIDEKIISACRDDGQTKYIRLFKLFKKHGMSIIDGVQFLSDVMNIMTEGDEEDDG